MCCCRDDGSIGDGLVDGWLRVGVGLGLGEDEGGGGVNSADACCCCD